MEVESHAHCKTHTCTFKNPLENGELPQEEGQKSRLEGYIDPSLAPNFVHKYSSCCKFPSN